MRLILVCSSVIASLFVSVPGHCGLEILQRHFRLFSEITRFDFDKKTVANSVLGASVPRVEFETQAAFLHSLISIQGDKIILKLDEEIKNLEAKLMATGVENLGDVRVNTIVQQSNILSHVVINQIDEIKNASQKELVKQFKSTQLSKSIKKWVSDYFEAWKNEVKDIPAYLTRYLCYSRIEEELIT